MIFHLTEIVFEIRKDNRQKSVEAFYTEDVNLIALSIQCGGILIVSISILYLNHENTIQFKSRYSQTWITAISFHGYMAIFYVVLSAVSESKDSAIKV